MKKKMLMRFAAVALAAGMCISGAGATYFSDGITMLLLNVPITT